MNRININRSITCLSLIMVLSSCTKETKVYNQAPERVQDKVLVSTDPNKSGEELTQAAEQLFGPYTFMLTHKMATHALEKDPTNFKAQFYYLLTKKLEAFRGIFYKIDPVLNAEEKASIKKFLNMDLPNSPLKSFLTEKVGTQLTKRSDAQFILTEYFNSVAEFYRFIKKNETQALELNVNPYVFEKQIKERMADSCKVTEKDGQYEFICNYTEIATIKLNMADFIGMRGVTAGELLYGLVYTSYSIEGVDKLDLEKNKYLSNQQKSEILFGNENFGKLLPKNLLGMVKEIGSDMSAATKWAIQHQSEICKPRPGYLSDSGLCIENNDETQNLLSLLDSALGGHLISVDLKVSSDPGQKETVKLDLFKIFENPIQDLRQVKPTNWNCDKANSFADNTFGGLFVENNANKYLLDTRCNH